MTATKTTKGFFLPGLDGLRFFAFFLVFLHHAPSADVFLTGHSILRWVALKVNGFGWMGVDLFLCLSAFLITKLLSMEFDSKGAISVPKFYARRLLRIWPLYFLSCFMGFLIFPYWGIFGPVMGSAGYEGLIHRYLTSYLVFLANWSTARYSYAPSSALDLLWTISLEEQFYLLWPLVLFFFKFKKGSLAKFLLGSLLFTLSMRVWAVLSGWPHPAVWVSFATRLDPFVLGTALALYHGRIVELHRKMPAWSFPAVGSICLLAVVLFPNLGENSPNIIWQLFSTALGFSTIIFMVTIPGAFRAFFSWPFFVRLGRISYGLYVYHKISIDLAGMLCIWVLGHLGRAVPGPAYWLLQFGSALGTVMVLAFFSYHFYEVQFLKLKKYFTVVSSRPID